MEDGYESQVCSVTACVQQNRCNEMHATCLAATYFRINRLGPDKKTKLPVAAYGVSSNFVAFLLPLAYEDSSVIVPNAAPPDFICASFFSRRKGEISSST